MAELLGGVARTRITPWWGVELTGLGYYLERTWTRIRDHLAATAMVLDDGRTTIAWIAVDLMVIDRTFSTQVREMVARETGIPFDNVLIGCSHSHNAPASGGLRGVGQCDPEYETYAARQCATAAIMAYRDRRPVTLQCAGKEVDGLLHNRTRADGPVENRLTVLHARDASTGAPYFVVVNFQGHPTIQMALGMSDVSRDWPGQMTDHIEHQLPEATALFFMGSSGDLNMLREFETIERCHEPARVVADAVLELLGSARDILSPQLAASRGLATLPTRRFDRDEVERELAEARYRLRTDDVTGWRETIGRAMVNRPDVFIETRYGGNEVKGVRAMARFSTEWIEQILPDFDTRPETLQAEVQAFRIGDLYLAAQPSELFSEHSRNLRKQFHTSDLMVVGYANERIGYVPDSFDLERRGYAAYQSPKYCGQFPFTAESGPALIDGMLKELTNCGLPK